MLADDIRVQGWRLCILALADEECGEAVMRLGIVRIEFQCDAAFRHGFVRFALACERET